MAGLKRARIIAIGDELLEGLVLDSNSHWLAQALHTEGWNLERIVTIGDDIDLIAETVRRNFRETPVTLVMGGMGPTTDDLTAAALAQAFLLPLKMEYRHLRDMEHLFHKRRWPMTLTNLKQSLIPRGFTYIKNPVGTAPMLYYQSGGHRLWVFPGVPFEMKHLFAHCILPALRGKGAAGRHGIISLFNISESKVQEIIHNLSLPAAIKMGYLPSPAGIRVKVGVENGDAKSQTVYRKTWNRLLRTFKPNIYSTRGLSLPQELGLLLKKKRLTLSVAESCTGGWISSLIVSVPGSSGYHIGGAITYSNAEKIRQLGVRAGTLRKEGAVSETTAREMAIGIARRTKSRVSLAVTGIAGPGGGTRKKPVGTVCLAVHSPGGTVSKTLSLFGERNVLRERAAYAALFYVFTTLKNQGG